MSLPNAEILKNDSSESVSLGFGTWRTPNTDRPVMVHAVVNLDATSLSSANAAFDIDWTGDDTADADLTFQRTAGNQDSEYIYRVYVPAGAQYRITNDSDPAGNNALRHVRECTL